MVEAKDYLIAGIGGAATGFFDNQEKQNAEVKQQEQLKRQAELVMMKEERAAQWAMRKQKDQQSFEMDKLNVEQRNKSTEAEKKRAQELFDTGAKNEFEMNKLKAEQGFRSGEAKTKHGYDVELEGMRNKRYTGGDKTAKARIELEEKFEKSKKNEFGEDNKQDFVTWASTTHPTLFAEAYPDGATGTPAVKPGAGGPSKFGSIFQKVTGSAAAKVKQGANDQPATGALPAAATGKPTDTLKSESLPPAADATTKKVEAEVISNPASADIGQILGLFAKGVVNVGSMSLEGLKALKTALENTGDVSRAMTDPYRKLSAEVGQAIIDAGGELVAPVPYDQKTERLKQSAVKPQRGNLL